MRPGSAGVIKPAAANAFAVFTERVTIRIPAAVAYAAAAKRATLDPTRDPAPGALYARAATTTQIKDLAG